MVASVLNSPQAVRMSLHVVRAFVTFARAIVEYKKLGAKIAVLETKVGKHDKELQQLLEAIRLLIAPPQLENRKIRGFGKKAYPHILFHFAFRIHNS